jgi:UDP-N-acetylglucosamine--N-acetylmuramyl-(pentapeptide) pyrophosphoryl-undecaprenol N-acetylglucosamine transferase
VRPLALYRFISHWGLSVRTSREHLRALRAHRPVVVGAFGGFVAAPIVQAARVERVPIVMVNLDAVPGKANRWMARRVPRVLTAAAVPPGQPGPAWEPIPPIVRRDAQPSSTPEACRLAFGLHPTSPTLLITGGSQGAGSINDLLLAFLDAHPRALTGGSWQVIHQTGKPSPSSRATPETLAAAYAKLGIRAHVSPFLASMGEAWGAATLALCRAGAGNVAEVWASATPSIFMPYPHHRDQHQKKNAEPLAARGGATLVTDHIDPARNLAHAGAALLELLTTPARLTAMRSALKALGPADGAARVAHAMLDASAGATFTPARSSPSGSCS